ncbi:MAG: hypothetical protein GX542_04215, partial [Rhodococcus sp.]|nr:hypothetical protein [Rhodococcus sp. (in: high G+C Gram-positive bacteria)]
MNLWRVNDHHHAHAALAHIAPIDVIIDAWGGCAETRIGRLNVLFLHLAEDGEYQFVEPAGAIASEQWPGDLVGGDILAKRVGSHISTSVSRVDRDNHRVTLVKKHDHLLKLRDADADELIAAREPDLHVRRLLVRPGGSFMSRDTVQHHEAETPIVWPEREIKFPELYLRHYTGSVGYADHMLTHGSRSILPEAYRWHLAADPSNPATVNSSPAFARLTAP